VEEDLLLDRVRDVRPFHELRDIVEEVGALALVGKVGGEEDLVLAHQLEDVGQRALLDAGVEVEPLAPDIADVAAAFRLTMPQITDAVAVAVASTGPATWLVGRELPVEPLEPNR